MPAYNTIHCNDEGLRLYLAAPAMLAALTEARARMLDMMQQDDGQAYKEAEKAMPMIDEALAAARGES